MLLLVTGAAFLELPLPLAVLGHEGGTVLVVLNGLRLLSDPICNTRRPVTDRESVEQGHDDKAQAGASSQLRNADATTTKTSTIT